MLITVKWRTHISSIREIRVSLWTTRGADRQNSDLITGPYNSKYNLAKFVLSGNEETWTFKLTKKKKKHNSQRSNSMGFWISIIFWVKHSDRQAVSQILTFHPALFLLREYKITAFTTCKWSTMSLMTQSHTCTHTHARTKLIRDTAGIFTAHRIP
jgi:hypothetical protein